MTRSSLRSFLADDIEAFVSHKRTLGFPYVSSGKILENFDAFCADNFPDEVELTREVAMSWAERRDDIHNNTIVRRVSPIRGLAEYMIRHGKSAYVIPRRSTAQEIPYIPYIFTHDEIDRLISACDLLVERRRHALSSRTLACAIRLLYCTGMRHGEARMLRIEDVDLDGGAISIGSSKTSAGRIVYVDGEALAFLRDYDAFARNVVRDRRYFFSTNNNTPHSGSWLRQGFATAKCIAGIDEPGIAKRVHDLRHTFCVHRLNQWVREGKDAAAMLPYLSAYIGHKSLESTDYYLHLVPEFFPDYSALTDSRNDLIPSVGGGADGSCL